jgi:hypothetical protein
MKKVLLGIVGAIALAIIVVIGLAASKPDSFRVARKTTIAAPPEAIYPYVDDFHNWSKWSPWEKLDPKMNRDFGGSPSGPGATYGWTGNNEVGEGKMTIIDAHPNQQVRIKLEFIKPFESTNTAIYDLQPTTGGTEVTWAMEGPNSFVGKLFSVFADMDSMIGKDFESGLANLKRVSESGPASAAN